jgi:hypothetical protein
LPACSWPVVAIPQAEERPSASSVVPGRASQQGTRTALFSLVEHPIIPPLSLVTFVARSEAWEAALPSPSAFRPVAQPIVACVSLSLSAPTPESKPAFRAVAFASLVLVVKVERGVAATTSGIIRAVYVKIWVSEVGIASPSSSATTCAAQVFSVVSIICVLSGRIPLWLLPYVKLST